MEVIQEFSLAQNITLVCGRRITQWELLEYQASRLRDSKKPEGWLRYEQFSQTRMSHHRLDYRKKTLFSLVETFERARCVDPRDKVYALLNLSSDGKRVKPDYSISAVDLFFRLLSLHPPLFNKRLCGTESEVFPIDKRSPWAIAGRIRRCIALEKRDMLASCRGIDNDKLYTWLEHKGTVASVYKLSEIQQHIDFHNLASPGFPCEVRVQPETYHDVFRSSADVWPGDEIFVISLDFSESDFYVVLRPPMLQFIDMIVAAFRKDLVGSVYGPQVSFDEFEFLRRNMSYWYEELLH
jgi:hypothetical protein